MNFVLIFGPQAVGKMTVGQELAKKTDFKLFHNHMTIDMLAPIFGFNKEMWRLVDLFRLEIFDSVVTSDLKGLIFTYVWGFDLKTDWDFVHKVCEKFESRGGTIYFVELEADLEERLERNKSANRLEHKPTKRNVEESEKELKKTMEEHRLNSLEGEIKRENYLRINNTEKTAGEVTEIIKKRFNL